MAKELRGKNELIVGSQSYIIKLKQDFIIQSSRLHQNNGIYETIKHCSRFIQTSVEEIYDDLQENAAVLSYTDRHGREECIEFLEGLQDFYKILNGNGVSRINACISLLRLQDRKSKIKNPNDVDKAARLIKQGGRTRLSTHAREALVLKASKNGGKYAAAGKEDNLSFLESLGSFEDRDFYRLVMERYDYLNNPRKFYGKCGRQIASYDYMDVFEKRIFGSLDFFDGYNFGQDTKKALEKIKTTIEEDLKKGITQLNWYMEDNTNLNLKLLLEDLKKCRVGGIDPLIKMTNDLAYFLGRKEEWVRELQELLNVMHYGTIDGEPLDEDGIFDNNTDLALTRYYKNILYGEKMQVKITLNTNVGYAADAGDNIMKKALDDINGKLYNTATQTYEVFQQGNNFFAMRGHYLSVHRLIAAHYLDTHDEDGELGKLYYGEWGSVIGRIAFAALGKILLPVALTNLSIEGAVITGLSITGGTMVSGDIGGEIGRDIAELMVDLKSNLDKEMEKHPSLDLGPESNF